MSDASSASRRAIRRSCGESALVGDTSLVFISLRGFLSNLYVVLGILAATISAIGYVTVRRRHASAPDHVSQSALDRIRTEYR